MTIKEIARLAGVSPSTVSMVLNKKPGIGAETREKVMEIIEKKGYNPKSQGTKAKGNIRFVKYKHEGLLVERNGDFITRVIDGVEDEARKLGFNLSITNATSNSFEDIIESINAEDIDGIIFLGTEFDSEKFQLLQGLNAPIVVLDNQFKYKDYDAVVMDNEDGVYLAVEHLKSLGHTQIGHLKSALSVDNFKARDTGFKAAMTHLGIGYNKAYTFELTPNVEESYSMMTEYLKNAKSLPTAFFADNDIIAIGAIRALKQADIRVPEDISVVGFDDLAIGKVIDPPLTTIKILKKKMGQLAVLRLIEKLNGASDETLKILVGARLVERESTAKPAKKE